MIKYSIRGENIEVTDAIRNYVESKLKKIEKYFNAEQELDARINLKVYREKTAKVEVTIPLAPVTLRAEDVSQDMYGSIDLVVDKIERQIRKNKTKIAKKHREKSYKGCQNQKHYFKTYGYRRGSFTNGSLRSRFLHLHRC